MTYTDSELDTVVTVRDIRRVGGCVEGQIRWFKQFGMDWKSIVRNGVALRHIHEKRDGEGNFVVSRIVEKMRGGSDGQE